MKKVIQVLIFTIVLTGFSQTGSVSGKVIFKLDSLSVPGATVIISGTKIGAAADINGAFEIPKLKEGNYDLVVEAIGYGKDTIQNVIVNNNSKTKITLGLPAGKCHVKTSSKKCPIDGKTKNVIPILYGLPREKTIRKMKKGKVKLGGCEVTGCEPNWFCKEHKQEF
ncbi:MAG: carboxypeptidase-like regulatory domain-containing protein [Cellulophaga sp.]|uniref:carboxypeptidase-like regulatory domain-containing protein n=1 Tax=unclassified Cellulophaga TaxID=2634405 RepID=UPI000C2C6F6F|nr:carboxypeptidase-like regulatory domain-containing protein [Cellulophaga sp. RHA19]PKB43618.1 carboxypeptidase-like protein [Cellulophaga sp. RHA19]